MNALCGTLLWWQRLWRRLRVVRLVVVFAVLGVVSTVAVTWAMAWWLTSDPRRLSLTKNETIACATVTVTDYKKSNSYTDSRQEVQLVGFMNVHVAFGWPCRTMDLNLRVADLARPIGLVCIWTIGSHAAVMYQEVARPFSSVSSSVVPTVCLPLRPIPASFCIFSLVMSIAWFGLWYVVRWLFTGPLRMRRAESCFFSRLTSFSCPMINYAIWGFALSVAFAWFVSWNGVLDTGVVPPTSMGVIRSNEVDRHAHSFFDSGELAREIEPKWYEIDRTVWRGFGYVVTQLRPGKRAMMSDGRLVGKEASASLPVWTMHSFGLPMPAMTWECSSIDTVRTNWAGGVWTEMAAGSRGGVQICLPGDQPLAAYWEQPMRNRLPLAIEPLPMAFNVCFWGGGLWLIVWGSRRLTERYNARTGLCPSCGYDARGLARCPECGGAMIVGSAVAGTVAAGNVAGRA
jgi:hypothetical protein